MNLRHSEVAERTLDWLLNVYDEVDDPVTALEETIGDRKFSQQIFDAIQVVAKTDSAHFKKLFGCECGDVTARAFVRDQLQLRS